MTWAIATDQAAFQEIGAGTGIGQQFQWLFAVQRLVVLQQGTVNHITAYAVDLQLVNIRGHGNKTICQILIAVGGG